MSVQDINPFAISRVEAEALRSADPGPAERAFFENTGRSIFKWVHYFAVYDRWLAPFVGKAPSMLEIGVQNGGSLEMWRKVLGSDAAIFGIDIDPGCVARVDPPKPGADRIAGRPVISREGAG